MNNLSILDIINAIDSFSCDEKNQLINYIEKKTDTEKILNIVNSIAIKIRYHRQRRWYDIAPLKGAPTEAVMITSATSIAPLPYRLPLDYGYIHVPGLHQALPY